MENNGINGNWQKMFEITKHRGTEDKTAKKQVTLFFDMTLRCVTSRPNHEGLQATVTFFDNFFGKESRQVDVQTHINRSVATQCLFLTLGSSDMKGKKGYKQHDWITFM